MLRIRRQSRRPVLAKRFDGSATNSAAANSKGLATNPTVTSHSSCTHLPDVPMGDQQIFPFVFILVTFTTRVVSRILRSKFSPSSILLLLLLGSVHVGVVLSLASLSVYTFCARLSTYGANEKETQRQI